MGAFFCYGPSGLGRTGKPSFLRLFTYILYSNSPWGGGSSSSSASSCICVIYACRICFFSSMAAKFFWSCCSNEIGCEVKTNEISLLALMMNLRQTLVKLRQPPRLLDCWLMWACPLTAALPLSLPPPTSQESSTAVWLLEQALQQASIASHLVLNLCEEKVCLLGMLTHPRRFYHVRSTISTK